MNALQKIQNLRGTLGESTKVRGEIKHSWCLRAPRPRTLPPFPSLFQPLHIFLHSLSLPSRPRRSPHPVFFERVFLVRRREPRASRGLSFLRTGAANMVYGRPETVSDVYAREAAKKGRRDEEKWREMREEGGGEEFAKMPSHGSLQQAVKVRPGRGEKEKSSLGLWMYSSVEPDNICRFISVA